MFCAMTRGHTAVVKLLLSKMYVSDYNQFHIWIAYEKGYIDIVKVMMDEPKLVQSLNGIKYAIIDGCMEMVVYLMDRYPVDVELIEYSIYYDNTEITCLLIDFKNKRALVEHLRDSLASLYMKGICR